MKTVFPAVQSTGVPFCSRRWLEQTIAAAMFCCHGMFRVAVAFRLQSSGVTAALPRCFVEDILHLFRETIRLPRGVVHVATAVGQLEKLFLLLFYAV